MTDKPYLQYIGDGSALHDVPARDLTELEAKTAGVDRLIATGLYELPQYPVTDTIAAPKKLKPAKLVEETAEEHKEGEA